MGDVAYVGFGFSLAILNMWFLFRDFFRDNKYVSENKYNVTKVKIIIEKLDTEFMAYISSVSNPREFKHNRFVPNIFSN